MKRFSIAAIRGVMVLAMVSLLVACATTVPSGFQKHYQASTEVKPGDALEVLEGDGLPKVVYTDDLGAEIDKRRSEGYAVIGYSQFTGPEEGDYGLVRQAREVGATLVVNSSLEAGKTTKYRRIYQRDEGVVYEPILAQKSEIPEREAGADKADGPVYATTTVYRQTALYMARRTE